MISELVQCPHSLTFSRYSLSMSVTRINDSFILGHSTNGILGRGAILTDFETDPATEWAGTNCTLANETTTKIVGSKSLKLTSSASPFSILTTQSFGDISAYTTVGSGSPPTGTIGLWVYGSATDAFTAISLKIGSSASDYTQISGVKTFTNAFDLQVGWNYFIFRLKNGATTGTPDWTAVDYAQVSITSSGTPVVYVDYFTVGSGDVIGLNGLGDRSTVYSSTTTTY